MYHSCASDNVGYRPIRNSKLDPSGALDLMEGFTVKREDRAEEKDGRPSPSVNKWPDRLPRMRATVLNYYEHALDLGNVLFRLIALALGFTEDFLDDKTKSNPSRLRLLHYPSQESETTLGGAHSE
ncbi:hypothetical protein R3P38DRAFT_3108800 [Favolaschia claudopus]|uniref:Uncharacterized protein n=1 Tax=Favolaschia claudopus TaxID=2862362 RepID=A0AAV9ZJ11_9AGAR